MLLPDLPGAAEGLGGGMGRADYEMAQDTQPSQPPQAHLEDTDAPYGCSLCLPFYRCQVGILTTWEKMGLGQVGNHPQGARLRVGLRVLSAPHPHLCQASQEVNTSYPRQRSSLAPVKLTLLPEPPSGGQTSAGPGTLAESRLAEVSGRCRLPGQRPDQ